MSSFFPRFFVRLKSGQRVLLRAAQELSPPSSSTAVAVAAGATAVYALYLRPEVSADIFDRSRAEELQVMSDHKLTKRELRFLQFASIEFDDVIYMSPMDFIDSLTLDGPRERVYRRVVKEKELHQMLGNTPPFRRGGKAFFRTLDQKGLISYSEYIFLLTLLTKSKSAFRIAFLMFDDDDNGRIDKDEFLLIRSLTSSLRSTRKMDENASKRAEDANSPCQLDISDFHFAVDRLNSRIFTGTDQYALVFTKSEEEVRKQNTTLLMHLFGFRGDQTLSFAEFRQFYQNLQEELMEIEFHEFSRGKTTISPVDFARLILRYTIVNKDDYAAYIQRVHDRTSTDDVGVNLDQWALFSIFLNNLGEFQTAVRLYTNADMPVTKPEFSRAVQCTIGKQLDPVIVDMIFRIFDANNDGTLSYSEFLAVMNDRLHRGLKGRLEKAWGWKPYKSCVISELARQ